MLDFDVEMDKLLDTYLMQIPHQSHVQKNDFNSLPGLLQDRPLGLRPVRTKNQRSQFQTFPLERFSEELFVLFRKILHKFKNRQSHIIGGIVNKKFLVICRVRNLQRIIRYSMCLHFAKKIARRAPLKGKPGEK